jgi:hypothetical protein
MSPHNDTKRNWILGFLRDYAIIIPSVIAIMNGLLAVYASHYPFETAGTKLAFIIIVGSLSFAAIGATIYSNHLVIAARAKERTRIQTIREQFGIFIADGTNLVDLAANVAVSPPIDQANEWAANIENFLATNLGDSYVVRFRDSTGMPPGIFPASFIRIGLDNEHQKLWRWVYSRMIKLDQFIRESPW